MTFTCESALLAKALRDIVAIVPRGHCMPILSNVLIDAADGKLRVTTTDLEMMATRTIGADVSDAASATVDASRFSSVMASLPAGSQAKVTMGEAITLTAGRSRFRFGSLPADHYPPLPFKAEDGVQFEAGDDLLGALAIVRHAVSTDDTKPFITGVCVECADGKLTVIATDGKRLAASHVADTSMTPFRATLPTNLIDMVMKLGEATDSSVTIRIAEKAAQFDFGDTILTGKLISEAFPAYQRVIPTSAQRTATVDGRAMVDALKRVALMIDDKARRIHVTWSPGLITMANAGRDEGVEEVPCDYEGETVTMWFDNRYLRDAFAVLDSDHVVMGMNGIRDPMKLTTPTKDGVTIVVVPQFEGAN